MLKLNVKGLSQQEAQVVAELEFHQKYYFAVQDVQEYFENKRQLINTFYRLRKKGRIIKLSKTKYFLVPMKARHGSWSDHPFIAADEMCNGENYFIGGWAAANYWRLTDQIPFQVDVYTTKRQGLVRLFHARFKFHRTTARKIQEKSVVQSISQHPFRVLNKKEAQKWLKLHE